MSSSKRVFKRLATIPVLRFVLGIFCTFGTGRTRIDRAEPVWNVDEIKEKWSNISNTVVTMKKMSFTLPSLGNPGI